MKEPEDLVVAHKAVSPSEAELVRTILEGAEIFAMVPNRETPLPGIDMTPFDGEYSGIGCEVLVRAEDLERAKQVIADARSAGPAADENAEGEEGDSDASEGDGSGDD